MNNENLKPVQELTPFTKMIMTIGTLPTSFYASLSYYESMVWLYEYLKNEVIPAVNNNGEAVEELQAKYIELKSYIDDYFDNLDVQEEINHKLDEMALDGTLTNLIKDYVDPIYGAYEERINGIVSGQNENITSFENSVNNTLTNYNNKINGLFNYSPIPVSSTSDMTDTTKIYVNTTNGKWYYYDGDSWEIGGTYQSSSNDEILDTNSTNAVQNKVITNAVSNVLDITTDTTADIEDITIPTLTSGFIAANGTIVASDTYFYTQKISVNEGDTIQILSNAYSASHGIYGEMRFICAYDENDEPVEAKGSGTGTYLYSVPSGIASIVISAFQSSIKLVLRNYTGTIQNVKSKYNRIETLTSSITNYEITTTDGVMDTNGIITASDSYEYTSLVNVSKGDVVIPLFNNNSNYGARVVITRINDNPINQYGIADSGSHIYKYIVTNDYINKVQFCAMKSAHINSIVVIHKENISQINNDLGGYEYRGEIETGETISFDVINLKPSYNINYSSHITTLDKIQIGVLNGETFSELVGVDSTNLEAYSGSSITTEAHGLTITNDLAINVRVEPYNMNGYDIATISLFSNGEEYTTKGSRAIYTYDYKINGKIALKINNSVVDTCSFSVGIENMDKPIWIFGDSWISNYSQRWVHWLYANDNAKNCWFNGYPGENSANGLIALKNALKLKTPKYLLWLYGMNDTDTTDVNSSWLSCLNEVIEICNAKSIKLILCTIPSSSVQLNQKKNEIVKNSGYRYFDQAGALEFNGTWLEAYKADNAHPTTEGAKALYYKLLTDVPEITNYE